MRSAPSFLSVLPLLVLSTACGGSTKANNSGLGVDAGDDAGVEASAPEAGPEAEAPVSWPVAVQLYSCLGYEYTAGTTIGTQKFQLAIDTGSTTLGVAAKKCGSGTSTCAQSGSTACCGANPLYTPGPTGTDANQTIEAQYGSGQWNGEIYTDQVAAGTAPPIPLAFGAIDSQQGFFQPIPCNSPAGNVDGIMGFGPSSAAEKGTTGYFDGLIATAGAPDIFAVQLCDSGGTLWLGGYDSTKLTSPVQYTPMVTIYDGVDIGDYYYLVDLETITINGTALTVPSGDNAFSVVDTGTSSFLIPTTVFTAITTALDAPPGDAGVPGDAGDAGGTGDGGGTGGVGIFASLFNQTAAAFFSPSNQDLACTSATKAELDAQLPPLTLTFGAGASAVTLQAAPTESYLSAQNGCWAPGIAAEDFGAQGAPIVTIMGDPVLRNATFIFDRTNNQVGIATHAACN